MPSPQDIFGQDDDDAQDDSHGSDDDAQDDDDDDDGSSPPSSRCTRQVEIKNNANLVKKVLHDQNVGQRSNGDRGGGAVMAAREHGDAVKCGAGMIV
ncbi:hypothetical protein M0R45_000320 [Rubus argutus]|uniref:Uncharacterized protein n=1 Tax=Rubus argutus TaxID=59490 RepID=A0AAW1VQV6_RUBAR